MPCPSAPRVSTTSTSLPAALQQLTEVYEAHGRKEVEDLVGLNPKAVLGELGGKLGAGAETEMLDEETSAAIAAAKKAEKKKKKKSKAARRAASLRSSWRCAPATKPP